MKNKNILLTLITILTLSTSAPTFTAIDWTSDIESSNNSEYLTDTDSDSESDESDLEEDRNLDDE